MYRLLLPIFISIAFTSTAQQSACGNNRYIDTVFSDFTLNEGVKYGQNVTIAGENLELMMDIYEPTGDVAEKRAAMVIAFGGSFIAGERGDVAFLCETYAKRGYVAVAIDYRLFDRPLFPIPSGAVMQDVVLRSVQDMKAAIRFLKEDAGTDNEYRVDPEYIYVGGISAGSITACHTALLDLEDVSDPDLLAIVDQIGGLEGASNDITDYDSEVKGLFNYSGGLNDASWIDANDVPIFSVHDDMDPIVPYDVGFATIVAFGQAFPIIEMDGSFRLMQEADAVGVENELITIPNNDGHVSYFFDGVSAAGIIQETSIFLEKLTCRNPVSTVELEAKELTTYPNPSNGLVFLGDGSNVYDISVFDQSGRKVATAYQSNSIDLSKQVNGQYMIVAEGRSQERYTQKLVISK